jgi:hypothetical protein
MNKILNILLMCIMLLAVSSCSDDDNNGGSIAPVTNVTATSNYGSVKLNWTNPTDSGLYYIRISYVDSTGATVNKKVYYATYNSEGVPEALVSGFSDTKSYDFTLVAVNRGGGESTPVTVSCAPLDANKLKYTVLESVTCEDIVEGGCLSWINPADYPTQLVVTYTDANGVEQKVTIDATKTGKRNVTGITKTTVFTVYAVNTLNGSRTENTRTFTVSPKVDPDDVVDPNIDYMAFSTAGLNNATLVQDNPDNATQYHFSSTGGDPYIYSTGLKSDVPGYVLKFRYKVNQDVRCEFFWIDKGGGPAGGRETVFHLKAADAWTTFTYDFTSDATSNSWVGKAGDSVRFDFADDGGVELYFRNMHWVVK